jgi:WD40 repeat protein
MLLAVGFVNEVVLYDTQSWETVWTVPDTHGPVKFSPAGSRLAAGAGAQAIVFDVASGTTVYSLELGDGRADLTDLVFTSDSSLLVTGTSHQSMGSPKGDARIWDMATGELVRTLECSAMSLALMADDATLAAACWSTVKAWNLADGSELLSIPVMEIALTLRFAPEEQHVAVGTFMGNVMVFEWKTLGSAAPTAQFPYPGMRALTYLDHDTLLLGAWKHPTVYRWTY